MSLEARIDENGMVHVRNTANPDGPDLMFDQDEFDAFLTGVKAGEFDFPTEET